MTIKQRPAECSVSGCNCRFLGRGFQSLKIVVKYYLSYLKIIVRCIIISLSIVFEILLSRFGRKQGR